MFINDLNEHEIGTLLVALKYWRAHRHDTGTPSAKDTVNVLLAKLEGHLLTSITSTDRRLSVLFRR